MFLHLGGDTVISQDKIVAIIDLETSVPDSNEEFLQNVRQSQKITYVSDPRKAKSLVITHEGYYFSPISSITLLRRSASFEENEES